MNVCKNVKKGEVEIDDQGLGTNANYTFAIVRMYCVGLILLLEGHRKWKRLLSPTLPTNPTKSNTTGLNRFKLHRSYFMQESLEVQYYTLLAV